MDLLGHWPRPVDIAVTLWLIALLGWIAWHDLRWLRIPDRATLALVGSGLLNGAILAGTWPVNAMIGAAAGFGIFAAIGAWYFRRHGQDGLGLGDAKLLGGIGAWLGWQSLPAVVALSATAALIFALASGRRKLAFGPWLAAVFLCLWLVRISGY